MEVNEKNIKKAVKLWKDALNKKAKAKQPDTVHELADHREIFVRYNTITEVMKTLFGETGLNKFL